MFHNLCHPIYCILKSCKVLVVVLKICYNSSVVWQSLNMLVDSTTLLHVLYFTCCTGSLNKRPPLIMLKQISYMTLGHLQ